MAAAPPVHETLTSKQGDTLDGLLWRDRGLGPTALVTVLALNPGLAGHGDTLPIGTMVALPAASPQSRVRPLIQLWD